MSSTKINKEIAELCGIILGDGNLHKKCNLITIVGSLEDIHYYNKKVIPLFNILFNLKPKLKKRNDRDAYYLSLQNKEIFKFLTQEIGLIRGNKINAEIPKVILRNKEIIPHFLRGLFDTDGGIRFSKQKKEHNYYPRIKVTAKHSKFGTKIGYLFKKLGFNYYIWHDRRNGGHILNYEISGKENLEKWFKTVKSSNPVHISKYLFWKKFGYHIPRSTLNSRLKALNLNIEDISL